MFAEDLSAFFDTANGFAQNATLSGGAVVPVIFDKAGFNVLGDMVESTGPRAVAKSADVSALSHGGTLVIGGTTYAITAIDPDGTGLTALQLRA